MSGRDLSRATQYWYRQRTGTQRWWHWSPAKEYVVLAMATVLAFAVVMLCVITSTGIY